MTSISDLVERLLKRTMIDLEDIDQVRAYLEDDSVLHHEVARELTAATAHVEALTKALGGVMKFVRKYPEFKPNPDLMDQWIEARDIAWALLNQGETGR